MNLPANKNNDESLLMEVIKVSWKYKWVIGIITIFTTLISSAYALLSKEVFSTRTVFIANTGSSGSSNLQNLASLAGIPLGGGASNVDPSNYLDKIVQDKDFLLQILNRKWLYKGDSTYLENIWKIKVISKKHHLPYSDEKIKLDFIRKVGAFGIKKDIRTGILTLNVNMPDPVLAYDVNSFVISLLNDYIRNSIKSQAKEKREFIEGRIKDVKNDLEKNENALALFRERNIASVSAKSSLEEMRLMRAITLSQELFIQFQKQFEIARVEELNDQTLLQILQKPEIPLSRSKPNRKKIVMFGFLSGCIIGFLYSYLVLERKKHSQHFSEYEGEKQVLPERKI